MKRMMWSVAMLVAVVLPAGAVAQSGTMAKGDKMDKMEMKDASYTGCIAAGMAAGTFMLTHVSADAMGKNAMKKDSMKKDTMAKDAMEKDTMTPESLALASSSVDLSKHLGHKVAITGSLAHGKMDAMGKDTMAKDGMAKDAPAFTVKSLKMVSASCS
jgi:pentapeptide MXKDX repeat protein